MMLKAVAAATIFLLSFQAQANTKINDPKGLLADVRAFTGIRSFEEVFKCNDSVSMKLQAFGCESVGCTEDGCWTFCATPEEDLMISRSVISCSSETIQILTDLSGDLNEYTRTDFEQSNKSVAELFLSQLGAFTTYTAGEVTITSLAPVEFTLARGTPSERKVEAMNVMFEFGEPLTSKFQSILTVLKKAPGVAQIARLRLDGTGFFLVNDFQQTRAPMCEAQP